MLRRLFIAVIATQFSQNPFFQIQAIVIHCILVLLYTAWVRPFELPVMNYMEIFNEFCVLAAASHLFLFTDFVEDPKMQYIMGWSIIGVSILNMVANIGLMMWVSFWELKLTIKKLWFRYQLWRVKIKKPDVKAKKAPLNSSSD
jgi:hypothetical protein